MVMKNKGTAALLAVFFGGIGFHRFYLGRPLSGFIYLFFCWTFIPMILALIEAAVFTFESEKRFNGEFNPHLKLIENALAQKNSNQGEDSIAKLERLATLKEKGVLTEDEFQVQKRSALG